MGTIFQDLRYAARQLRNSPGYTAVAVLTLGLGIGANTAIFSVVNAVLLRPLPYHDPSRLVKVQEARPDGTTNVVSYLNFTDWRKRSQAFASLSLFRGTRFNLSGGGQPERVTGALVTAEFFRTLGVTLARGRSFAGGEDRSGQDQVAIVSHRLWRSRFGGTPAAVGRPLRVDGRVLTIVGIAPDGFRYPEQADVWVPISHDDADLLENRGLHGYEAIGRLRPDVTVSEARSRMAALAVRLAEQYPATNKGWGIGVVPLQDALVGGVRPTLLMLLGAVGFVVLIAAVNVANMMLARTAVRRREISIRTALGASRARLVRQLLTESLLVALSGGALGVLLALWGSDALASLGPDDLAGRGQIVLNGAVFAFALLVTVATSLIFGLAPAWYAIRQDFGTPLREGGRSAGGLDNQRIRRFLVVAEIALSLLLLIGAGLMVRSFQRLLAVDPGFNPDRVLTARLSLPESSYGDSVKVVRFYDRLLDRVSATPGVVSVAAVSSLPLGREGARYRFTVEGRPAVEPQQRPGADFYAVSPGYFATLEIPVLRGRAFGPRDRQDGAAVVIVNETLARRFWPGESAVGKRLTFGEAGEDAWLEIVGVVADVKQRSLSAELKPQVYAPESQVGWAEMSLLIRTGADPMSLAPMVSREVQGLDKDQPVSDFRTLDDLRSDSVAPVRFRMLLLGSLAGMALLLASIGVYGVIAYGVSQRARELGLRMALGAQRGEILRLVVGEGMLTVGIGMAGGVAAAVALSRVLSSLLYAVTPTDPATFAAICALVAAVALLACLVPARRALRVDPMTALRSE